MSFCFENNLLNFQNDKVVIELLLQQNPTGYWILMLRNPKHRRPSKGKELKLECNSIQFYLYIIYIIIIIYYIFIYITILLPLYCPPITTWW